MYQLFIVNLWFTKLKKKKINAFIQSLFFCMVDLHCNCVKIKTNVKYILRMMRSFFIKIPHQLAHTGCIFKWFPRGPFASYSPPELAFQFLSCNRVINFMFWHFMYRMISNICTVAERNAFFEHISTNFAKNWSVISNSKARIMFFEKEPTRLSSVTST